MKIKQVAELPGHGDCAWHIAWNPQKPVIASCSADKTVRLYSYKRAEESSDPSFSYFTTISTGHEKTVRSVAWAPSGNSLATASFDSNIGIWAPEEEGDTDDAPASTEWECVNNLEGHETECKSVAYSPTGTMLASCSRDKTVWIWEVQPDADYECLSVLMEHTQDVKCVAWHTSEEILASASYDDTIKLYMDDPSDDWFCFATLTGHTSTVWSLAWSPCGRYLASSSDDRTVRIWKRVDVQKWVSVLVLTGHERSVYSVTWGVGKPEGVAGDGDLGWIASTGSDGSIRVWEISAPEDTSSISTPPNHRLIAQLSSAHGVHDVNAVTWCPRKGYEEFLASTGDDGSVKIWKVVPEE